jgi:hypothetical protein
VCVVHGDEVVVVVIVIVMRVLRIENREAEKVSGEEEDK